MDEALATNFKQFVVDEKIGKADAQKIIGLHNKVMGTARDQYAAEVKAANDRAAADHIAAVRACNDALVAHEDFGDQEKLDKQTVLLHRALVDNVGISGDRAEEIAAFMKDGMGATDPVIRRAMLKTYAPLAAESSQMGPGQGRPAATVVKSEQDKQVAKDIGWTP